MSRRTLARPRAHLRLVLRMLSVSCALLAAASRLPAQQVPASPPVSLGEVFAELRTASPRLAAADALVRAAESRIPGAGLPPDPEVQVGWMNYSLPGLAPMDPLGMRQLQVMQMLPLGGKLGLARDIARTQASAQSRRAANAWWELRAEGASRFYQLHQLDARLAVMRETVRLLDDIRRTAESMYRVGEGRQADVLRAQVELARMTEDTLRMQTMRTATAAQLAALLDREAGTGVGTTERPAFPAEVPTSDALQALAYGNRPMLGAAADDLAAAAQMAEMARKERIPDLEVGVQLGQRGVTMTSVDAAGMPMSERRTEWMGSLMLGARVPIFAASRQRKQQEEAEAMRQMAAAELAEARAGTRARIATVHAELLRARTLATLYRTTILPQAQAAVASAQSAYRVGTVDFMTLLDNQMALNRYRQELAMLVAEEGTAWAELEALTGTELLEPAPRGTTDGGVR